MKGYGEDMDIYDKLLDGVVLPRFVRAHYQAVRGTIRREDIPALVRKTMTERHVLDRLKPGDSVAVGVGSRDINNYDCIVKAVLDVLKEAGAEPFIFPAMGSHAGSTAEGQRGLLKDRGISEETMGVPVYSSMEAVVVGRTPHGLPVHMDRYAASADWIVTIGRVKPHTDFHGPHESGLFKMLAVGCGKQIGAAVCHSGGYGRMGQNVAEIAAEVLGKCRVLFGMAVIEDAFRGTYKLEAVRGEDYPEEDTRLLAEAKALVPRIPFAKIDMLVLNEFGKDISGAGMDPNVTGRLGPSGIEAPYADRIVVLDLTEASHHNFAGIGAADVITQRFMKKVDFLETYPNCITSRDLAGMKLPVAMPNDLNAVRIGLQTIPGAVPEGGWRIVWMKNTLGMDTFLISEALVKEAERNERLKVEKDMFELRFDGEGNLKADMMELFQ